MPWPIGFPAPYDEGQALAFAVDVGREALAAARQRLDIATPQLFEAPPHLPQGVDVQALEEVCTLMPSAGP